MGKKMGMSSFFFLFKCLMKQWVIGLYLKITNDLAFWTAKGHSFHLLGAGQRRNLMHVFLVFSWMVK